MQVSDLVGPLDAAIYETVNGYVDPVTGKRGGSTALAPRVGMQPNTLSNKANPNCDHKLGLLESIPIQLATNNFSILHAYSSELGHCAFRLPNASDVGDLALLDTYADMHARLGDFAQELRAALADNRISRVEVTELRQHFDDAVRAGLGVIARMEAIARD